MIVSACGLIRSVADASFCSRQEQNLSRLPQSVHFPYWSAPVLSLVGVGDAGLRLKCVMFGDVMSSTGPLLHGTFWGTYMFHSPSSGDVVLLLYFSLVCDDGYLGFISVSGTTRLKN